MNELTNLGYAFEVRELIQPDLETAENIGRVMPFLSDRPVDIDVLHDRLQRTAASPSAAQFVARISEPDLLPELHEQFPIVGAATISTLHGALGEKAWIEDFVVAPDARPHGVAQQLWDGMNDWREEHGLGQMRFNSTPNRERAHGFYARNGCDVLAEGKTTLFVHNL